MRLFLNNGQTILGRFQVENPVAIAGQGVVYQGRDTTTGKAVAIKRLAVSPTDTSYSEQLQRFIQEGNIRISNSHIPDPLACGEEDGSWYLVMPFIDGHTLDIHVQRSGSISWEECVNIVRQVADALAAIHNRSLIHRDLKPQNIMIQADGHVWVIDLGIVKALNAQPITQGSGLIGTWQWMSPEQINQNPDIDHRSDLYALGANFYWLLTGQEPWNGQDYIQIHQSILHTTPAAPLQLNSAIPVHVDAACRRLLEKNPDARFQSAAEFSAALQCGFSDSSKPKRFCTACGSRTTHKAKFCNTCGAALCTLTQTIAFCLACGTAGDGSADCPGCHRIFSRSGHRLCFTGGTPAGKEFRIPEGDFITGRQQISPRDGYISKQHMHVVSLNGAVYVHDAGSINRTRVGHEFADRLTLLQPGCAVTIGGSIATYSSH